MARLELQRLAAFHGQTVNAVMETPRGSRAKYKYDEETGLFRLKKLLPLGASFPYNFGFIPSTQGEDGDALDIMVLLDEALFAGCVVPVRLIGVIEAFQTEKGKRIRNDRFLGVFEGDAQHKTLASLEDLPRQQLKEIEHFFISYNQAQDRLFEPVARSGPEQAMALVRNALAAG